MAGKLEKTEKPVYHSFQIGFSEYLQLGESFSIENGNIEAVITMYVSPKALQSYSGSINPFASPKPFILSYPEALTKFSKRYYNKYKEFLLDIFGYLIQKYKGFPSHAHLTKKVWFIFDISNSYQATVEWSSDFELVQIKFSVNSFNIPKSHRINTVMHELLHIISEVHQGEDRIRKLIERYQRKLEGVIEQNEKIFREGFYELIDNLSAYVPSSFNRPGREEYFTDLLRNSVDKFYTSTKDIFWNFIADAALCVIAIELDDLQFISYAVNRDTIRVEELRNSLIAIKNLQNETARKEKDNKRKIYFLQILKLVQFMLCVIKMPSEGIAYGILGEDWRPLNEKRSFLMTFKFWQKGKVWHRNKSAKNIEDFKAVIIRYCDPDIAEGFLRFFDSFLAVVSAQTIHNDPLNPNITKQIFDTECLKRGKNAYKILNQEFNKLFRRLNDFRE